MLKPVSSLIRALAVYDDGELEWVKYENTRIQVCKSCREGIHKNGPFWHLPKDFKIKMEHFKKKREECKNDPDKLEEFVSEFSDFIHDNQWQRYECKREGILDGKHMQCFCSTTGLAWGQLDVPYSEQYGRLNIPVI